jgi:hypothetical protein
MVRIWVCIDGMIRLAHLAIKIIADYRKIDSPALILAVVLMPCQVESAGRHRCRSLHTLMCQAMLTEQLTDITEVFPEEEVTTSRIDCLDKTHLPTQEWYPLMRLHIVKTFMAGTIQEF